MRGIARAAVLAVLVTLAAAGPASGKSFLPSNFVAKAIMTDQSATAARVQPTPNIGLSIAGGQVVAYICDGDQASGSFRPSERGGGAACATGGSR